MAVGDVDVSTVPKRPEKVRRRSECGRRALGEPAHASRTHCCAQGGHEPTPCRTRRRANPCALVVSHSPRL